MDLAGKRVLIVGGTSGIGFAVASAVADKGAVPVVVSRRQNSVDRAVAALPDGAQGATVDLTDSEALTTLARDIGVVDHLVFTAGEPLELIRLADLTPDVIGRFFQTRYVGAVGVVRAFAGQIGPGGSITLTSGTAADRPGAGWALGASICGAMNALTRALAVELAPLRVNAVAPGVLRSPLWASLGEADRESMYAQLAEQLPLGRVGDVEDAARAYVYSMEQDYGTGVILTVDGGTVLA
jgi:NAD(P)-dependent dehydrogenase (short-subunit alcohol dehydrogenase family)